jgi:GTP-binding protein Era
VTRSGFVALAGRPNAGKSTLVNRIVGDKVAIVSDKPQTTRREVRGIATTPEWQLVLVDLPGVQRPRDSLTERMQRRVEHTLSDSDAVLFVVNGAERIGPGDRSIMPPGCTSRGRSSRPAPRRGRGWRRSPSIS